MFTQYYVRYEAQIENSIESKNIWLGIIIIKLLIIISVRAF